uniref:Eukaryotic translation initiation factor 2 alpha kinase 2 n=1 Tax=Junco hyemalis TaxID=40217 RepID=A0A8C5IEV7_JUNHY
MDREYMAKINWYGQKENCNVVYVPVARTGPAHDPEFTFVVKIDGEEYGRGTGKTIKEAKAVAAKETWEMIDKQVNLTTAQTTSTTSSPALDKDYVSLLNIYSQKTGFIVDYPNKNRTGDPHVPTHSVSCTIRGQLCGRGTGPSLAAAKQAAAKEAYEKVNKESSVTVCAIFSLSQKFLELFEKIQHIGAGGFGNVFKATSKCDKTTYAIKRVEYTKKVEREARGLARLSHENIVRYHCSWRGYDRIKPDGAKDNEILCLFIQMEFCEQGTLEDWVIKNSEDRKYHEMAQNKFLQIAKGVQCIHSEELIHRDLKPQNIFISHDNKIKIGDFGLVTSVAFETLTENRGTRSYMAPEQIGTKYGREVDIYALGLIWFEILSAITAHEKSKVWSSAREGELPEYFKIQFPASIIKKMLSRDPSGRITISHLLDLLNSVDKEKALRNYSY